MHSGHRVNALIMELVIALLFFSIASVVIMGVFSTTSALSKESTATSAALYYAEDLAERLSVCEDLGALIESEGLGEGISVGSALCRCETEAGENGIETAFVTVTYNDETVLTLPVSRICGTEG